MAAMRDLDGLPPERLVRRGEELLDLLRRRQDPLAAPFEAVQRELAAAEKAQREASEQVRAAVLERDAADEQLDALVAELSLAALDLAGGNTADRYFHGLFPDGPQVLTTVPIEVEVRLVRDLLDRLRGHPLDGRFRAELEGRLAHVEGTERRLGDALGREAETYPRLRRATVGWLLQSRLVEAAAERAPQGTP
jgi:hypothetical protein